MLPHILDFGLTHIPIWSVFLFVQCFTATMHSTNKAIAETVIATRILGRFCRAKSLFLTMILLMLLFFRIPFQSSPARDAEKTKEYAPKFVPRASAYIDPMRSRSSTGELESFALSTQNAII